VPLYTTRRPEILDIIADFRALADAYSERVLIGELYLPIERLMSYYGVDGRGLHLPFNFHLIQTPWRSEAVGALIERYEAALPASRTGCWVTTTVRVLPVGWGPNKHASLVHATGPRRRDYRTYRLERRTRLA
jgi:hypothetical protein